MSSSSRGPRPARAVLLGVLAGLVGATATAGPVRAELEPPPTAAIEAPPATWSDAVGELDAPIGLLVAADTGQVLVEIGPTERPRAVASTVKLLTALSVVERTEGDDRVVVGDEVEVAGASTGLEPGDERTVGELLEAMLVRSGNDAAEALAAHVTQLADADSFAQLLRADARDLGLEGVRLRSPTGLDDRNRLAARDLATLARAALDEPRLAPTLARRTIELPGVGTVDNRNELLGTYRGATGAKTGFTQQAGNSLVATARRDGRELIAVVLGAGDDPARFEAARTLLDHGFADTERERITGEIELAVAGGERRFALDPVTLTHPSDREVEVEIDPPARPPERALEVTVRVGGATLAEPSAATVGTGPEPSDAAGELGRAAVDGAWAALRSAAGAGALR